MTDVMMLIFCCGIHTHHNQAETKKAVISCTFVQTRHPMTMMTLDLVICIHKSSSNVEEDGDDGDLQRPPTAVIIMVLTMKRSMILITVYW